MQPDLPWNVAGIAPEAREAARVSARREGLSVAEWLTRRILVTAANGEASQEDWPVSASAPGWRSVERAAPAPQAAGIPAHVTQSESETQKSTRRIEDQLKNLARRLEQTERSQAENSRVVTQAAREISAVSREQAQAFDQLGTHAVRLDERLARIEQVSTGDGMKEAVKALHLGLSRLADQVAETASRSTAQAAQLAGNMESVVGKLAESREEGQQSWRALEERVAALAGSVGSIAGKLLESRDVAERAFHAIENRIAAAEETLARLDAAKTDEAHDRAETSRHAAALTRLSESVETLSRQFASDGSDVSDRLAQQDERLVRVEAAAGETALAIRFAAVERQFEDELRSLGLRLDVADQHHRDAIAELTVLVKDISARLDSRVATAAIPDVEPVPQNPTHAALPPLPEEVDTTADALPQGAAPNAAAPDAGLHTFGKSGLAGGAAERRTDTGLQSFFAAARSSTSRPSKARDESSASSFTATTPRAEQSSARKTTWMILMTALAGIVIAAVVTGTLLNRPPPNIPQVISTRAAAPASLRHAPPAKTSSASAQDRVAALAERGDAKAEALQGLEYAEGRGRPVNEAEGAKWLERAALQGEAIAAWRLGSMYERGHGVPADPAKAVQWYRVAAKAGNRKAMHNLAIDYVNGTGVTKDFAAAAFWFARAASLGLADSEFNLGVLYERGLGVPQSLTDAYKWYAIAAAQGDAESKERLSALATQISPGDRVAAEKAAADFRPANPSATANSPPDPASVTGG